MRVFKQKVRRDWGVSMSGMRWISSTGLFIAACFALAFPAPVLAHQNWRPINPADLTLKDNPASPGSDAMILYREETLNEQRNFRSEYYRIKIFTRKGVERGNVEIPYAPNFESVESLRARTILPNGTIVPFTGQVYKKVAYQGDGVKVYERSFSLPDVRPGCIIEYTYNESTDPGRYLAYMEWDVQRNLFTREAKFVFIPLSDVRETGKGFYGWRVLFPTGPERPQLQPNGSYVLVVHNVPALKTEPYMFPEEMIRSRVEFYYSNQGNMPTKKFWQVQGKKWNSQLGSFISRKGPLIEAVDSVVQYSDTPEVKLEKIYARVQQIRNLTFLPSMPAEQQKAEGIVTNLNAADVLKHGYGTRQDINELFVGLARAAGIDATLAYVAPRDRVMFVPSQEDPNELQSKIVEAKAGSQIFYLDPGSPQYPFGLVPWAENNVDGVLLTKHGGELIHVPGEGAGQAEISRHTKLNLGPDGSLAGTIKVDYIGQEAAIRRKADRNDDAAGRRKELQGEIEAWLPEGATFHVTAVKNWNDTSKPLRVEGTVKMIPPADRLYGRLALPLSLYGSALTDAFTSTQRTNSVYFHYPFEVLDDTSIQLPLGYQVESLPKVAGIPQGAIQYQITADAQAGTVYITRRLAVNGIAFPVKYYATVRAIFLLAKTDDATDFVLESNATAQQR